MTRRKLPKLVHKGQFVAKVDVELIYGDAGWPPYLSLDDALKLDTVREALRRGDFETANRLARVFELVPLTAEAR